MSAVVCVGRTQAEAGSEVGRNQSMSTWPSIAGGSPVS